MARVLVVEDEPTIVTVVRYHLEAAGFEGVYAGDVAEAWRLLVVESPDIAVVDIRLPGENGWALLEKMRADGRFVKIPAIVLTGVQEPNIADRASTLKCDYLSKPFAATALLSKIRHLIALAHPNGLPAETRRGDIVRVELVAIGVVLLLDGYRIEGKVYLPPELARFSDAWESVMRDQRTFVPITEARIASLDGSHLLGSPAFIEVRKAGVQAVFPMDLSPE
ncbi:MAG: response regulator [Actinobacteria bacterium]|nr:response regulator [Actinomycetota bacterium]